MANVISAYSNTGSAPPVFGGTTRIPGFETSSETRSSQWRRLHGGAYHRLITKFRSRTSPRPPWPQRGPLTVQHTRIPGVGLVPFYEAADPSGDSFVNVQDAVLQVLNTGNAPITVTITAFRNCEQGFNHPIIQVIPNTQVPTAIAIMGPFDSHYQNGFGVVTISYSSVYGVSVAVTAP